MGDPFGDLLRITPRCEAAKCRRNGTIRLTINKASFKKPQSASVCPKHAPMIAKAAEEQGCTVTLS